MEKFEWSTLENLKSYGVESISVENTYNDLAGTGDEFGAIRLDNGPKYNIELSVDSAGLTRLQKALEKEPRTPKDELKHELKVMHNVNDCEGENVSEKIDKYFEKVDNKAKACKIKGMSQYKMDMSRYKIRHR